MVETAPTRKLKRKPGARAAILNAPPPYQLTLAGMSRAEASLMGMFDRPHVFVRMEAELKRLAPRLARALAEMSMFWISFPRDSSKMQTDLIRDHGWDSPRTLDLKRGTLPSVDESWSAFGFRPDRLRAAAGRSGPER